MFRLATNEKHRPLQALGLFLVFCLPDIFCTVASPAETEGQGAAARPSRPIGFAVVTESAAQETATGLPHDSAASGRLGDATSLLSRRGHLLPKLGLERDELRSWDGTERSLLWSYIAFSAIDAYQTARQPAGFQEANPLLASWAGERPSTLETVLFKGIATYGIGRLAARHTRQGKQRKAALLLLNGLQLSIVLHNERVTGGIVSH